jgi:hypothetical protein
MIGNTKQIRTLVRKYYGNTLASHSYTDKASDPTMRLVTFIVDSQVPTDFKNDIEVMLSLSGFENRVKVTQCSQYRKYLRIKASVA